MLTICVGPVVSARLPVALHHRLKPGDLKGWRNEFPALDRLEQEHETPSRLAGRVDPLSRGSLIGICHRRPTVPPYRLALSRTE